jgi:hypothetical protein
LPSNGLAQFSSPWEKDFVFSSHGNNSMLGIGTAKLDARIGVGNVCPDSVAFPGKTGRLQIKLVRNSHVLNIALHYSSKKM